MKVELELPPLPDGWATGPVEIGYGEPPQKSIVLVWGKWVPAVGREANHQLYAVRKWQPQIVTAGILAPGWLVIDEDGTPYHSIPKPLWCEDAIEWSSSGMHLIPLSEHPQVTGRNAIWEIK